MRHLRVLIGVWLCGFLTGVRSSHKLEATCRDQIPYSWLTGRWRPAHITVWRFYARAGMAEELPKRTVQAAGRTKVGANAAESRIHAADGCAVWIMHNIRFGNPQRGG